ncbi:MAG: NmrA family NAD(P)-binding protein [Polyangiaceae bacterium]
MKETIFVTGGTGNVGTEIVKIFAGNANFNVRAGARDTNAPSSVRVRELGSNVEVVTFDVDRPETLAPALRDVTRVYVLPPFIENMSDWHRDVTAAIAREKSVKYVVKHSVAGARASTPKSIPSLIPRLHYEGEERIAATGISWSVIRPTIFMQHLTTMPWVYAKGDSSFYMPIGSGRAYFLDARDISLLAAHLLSAADPSAYFGRVFDLTGPEAIGGDDIASSLSRVAGRPITWVDFSAQDFAARMTAAGSSGWNTVQALHVYADTKEGWLGKSRGDDLERTTGHKSRSFEQFATDNASFFRRT